MKRGGGHVKVWSNPRPDPGLMLLLPHIPAHTAFCDLKLQPDKQLNLWIMFHYGVA